MVSAQTLSHIAARHAQLSKIGWTGKATRRDVVSQINADFKYMMHLAKIQTAPEHRHVKATTEELRLAYRGGRITKDYSQ